MATETGTVKIGGKPVSKKVLYGGGAVALGVVGYAWYTSSVGGTGTEAPEEELPEPVPEPTDEPGFDVTGGGPRPTTNAEWNAKAVQSLLNLGYDAIAVQAAIGKFLQRRPLNTVEAALVEAAIAAAGYPPENPPWVIIREQPGVIPPKVVPPPGTTPPPAVPPGKVPGVPGYMNASGTTWATKQKGTYDINFIPPGGATKFRWRWEAGGKASAWAQAGTSIIILSGTYKGIAKIRGRALFPRPTRVAFRVQAGNSVGWGPAAIAHANLT
jgi:hypothetical protein